MRMSRLIRVLLASVFVLVGSVSAKAQPNISPSNAATLASSPRVAREDIKKSIESFEEFRKLATQGDNGVYIVDDIAFANDIELRRYWAKTAVDFHRTQNVFIVGDTAVPASWAPNAGPSSSASAIKEIRVGDQRLFSKMEDAFEYSRQKLTANLHADTLSDPNRRSLSISIVDGARDIWDPTNRINLRYCVSDAFAENKGKVVTWVQDAADAWETLGKVKFIYVPSEDGNATSANNNVTFDVRPASQFEEGNNPHEIVARTFFPSNARTAREFVIYKSFLTMHPGYLFKHELGHALGFRHEHIWFGNWTGEKPCDAEALTLHDRASIMYYFFLPGYNGNMDFSEGDREGFLVVYPRS